MTSPLEGVRGNQAKLRYTEPLLKECSLWSDLVTLESRKQFCPSCRYHGCVSVLVKTGPEMLRERAPDEDSAAQGSGSITKKLWLMGEVTVMIRMFCHFQNLWTFINLSALLYIHSMPGSARKEPQLFWVHMRNKWDNEREMCSSSSIPLPFLLVGEPIILPEAAWECFVSCSHRKSC